jgi:phosphoribosyl 1,2-cyclic phosphodiesterase
VMDMPVWFDVSFWSTKKSGSIVRIHCRWRRHKSSGEGEKLRQDAAPSFLKFLSTTDLRLLKPKRT